MNDPATYDKTNGPVQTKDAEELIPQLIQPMHWDVEKVLNVLDFGCGSGYVTKNILHPAIKAQMPASSKLSIIGVDISKSAVEYAATNHFHPDISYRTFNILKQDWSEFEGKFDKIFSFHALHWIPDTKKALQNLHRMLKNGGELGIYYCLMHEYFPELDRARQNPDFGQFVHVFADTRNYADELEKAGFEIHFSKSLTRQHVYESKGRYADMVMSTGMVRVPAGLEAKFRAFFAVAFSNWFIPIPTPECPTRIRKDLSVVVIEAAKI